MLSPWTGMADATFHKRPDGLVELPTIQKVIHGKESTTFVG